MEIAEIRDIECALLHDRFAPLSTQKLFDIVSAAARDIGLTADLKGGSTDKYGITASVAGLHILVSQNEQPLAPAGFATALAQPITRIMVPEIETRVSEHQANTFVTVSCGLHIPNEFRHVFEQYLGEESPTKQAFTDYAEAKTAIHLAYVIANSIQQAVRCTAVHWCQSDFLVSPEFLDAVGKMPTLTPLCVRPNLFSSTNKLGRGLPVGMVGNGTQYLIGLPVVFKEANVDLEWMLERVSNFIDMCHIRGSVMPDGHTFGESGDEVIMVSHMPPNSSFPTGAYELTAVHVPRFGIFSRSNSASASSSALSMKEADTNNSALDPNDPIDLAILNKLEERRMLDERRSFEERRASTHQGDYPNDRRVAGGPFGRRTMPFGRRAQ